MDNQIPDKIAHNYVSSNYLRDSANFTAVDLTTSGSEKEKEAMADKALKTEDPPTQPQTEPIEPETSFPKIRSAQEYTLFFLKERLFFFIFLGVIGAVFYIIYLIVNSLKEN